VSLLFHVAELLAAISFFALAAGSAGRRVFAGLSSAERVAWSIALGVGLAALEFLLGTAFGSPAPAAMLGGALAVGAAGFALGRRSPAPPEEGPGALSVGALALAAAAVALFAIRALSEPMWAIDFFAIWGFKGKTMYFTGAVPARLFHDPATTWSHPEYPLGLPAAFAGFSAAIGRWDDHALAVLFPVLQAATAAALYGWTKRRFSAGAGAVAALLAAAFFNLYQSFEVGMAEVPLACALVLFGEAAIDFEDGASRASAGRLALAAFLASAIKQEGTLLVLLAAGWMGVRELRRRSGGAVAALSLAAVPAVLHELLLIAGRGVVADRDFDWSFARPARWGALARQAAEVGRHLFRAGDASTWIAIFALAAFAAAARPSRDFPALALLGPPLVLQSCAYVAVCAFSSFDPIWQASFVPRLESALFPVMVLAVAPRIASLFPERGGASNRVASG
jgi:hypothetical protein